MKFKIDPELRAYLPFQTTDERDNLTLKIVAEGCLPGALTVANIEGETLLIDGHNSYEICTDHEIIVPEPRVIELADRAAAKAWMRKTQFARRNLTPEQRAFLIGDEFNSRKKPVGNPHELGQNDLIKTTAEIVAEEQGVSPKTVQRAGKFAEAVNALDPVAKEAVLNGKAGATKEEIASGAKPILCKRCARVGAVKDCPTCAEVRAEKKSAKKKTTLAEQVDKALSEEQVPQEKVIRCQRCEDLEPDSNESVVPDCTGCFNAREQAKKNARKKKPKVAEKNDFDVDGNVIPKRLVDIFAGVELFKDASLQLVRASTALKTAEESALGKSIRPAKGDGFAKFSIPLRRASELARKYSSITVCPDCKGDGGCPKCGEDGFVVKDK